MFSSRLSIGVLPYPSLKPISGQSTVQGRARRDENSGTAELELILLGLPGWLGSEPARCQPRDGREGQGQSRWQRISLDWMGPGRKCGTVTSCPWLWPKLHPQHGTGAGSCRQRWAQAAAAALPGLGWPRALWHSPWSPGFIPGHLFPSTASASMSAGRITPLSLPAFIWCLSLSAWVSREQHPSL